MAAALPSWRRYHGVAIALHWLIAAAIVVNLLAGWWMHEAIDEAGTQALAAQVFQWHKSLGLTILLLSLLRLCWRLARPPLPATEGRPWERRVAALTHWAFYGLMLGLPLSGWLYVSTQWRHDDAFSIPTLYWGLFEVPHLLGLAGAPDALRAAASERLLDIHDLLASGTALLLALHVGAALKHHWLDRDHTLQQMSPAALKQPLPAGQRHPRRGLLAGLAVVAVIGLGTGFSPFSTEPAALAPSALTDDWAERATAEASLGPAWPVIAADSRIRFAGDNNGDAFDGEFTRWEADIRLPASDPTGGRILARIATGSAKTGNAMYDRTLAQGEWFDATAQPHAYYRSARIERVTDEDDTYEVHGTLLIKGRDIAVPPLQMRLREDHVRLSVKAVIDRGDADLGMRSDPQGDYVARAVDVRMELRAARP